MSNIEKYKLDYIPHNFTLIGHNVIMSLVRNALKPWLNIQTNELVSLDDNKHIPAK